MTEALNSSISLKVVGTFISLDVVSQHELQNFYATGNGPPPNAILYKFIQIHTNSTNHAWRILPKYLFLLGWCPSNHALNLATSPLSSEKDHPTGFGDVRLGSATGVVGFYGLDLSWPPCCTLPTFTASNSVAQAQAAPAPAFLQLLCSPLLRPRLQWLPPGAAPI